MNNEQIIKVLKNERECIARQTGHSEHKEKPDWQLIEIDYIHGCKKWLCNHCGLTIYNTLYEEMENVACGCMKENKCDRKCEKCDLFLPDDEILEVYDFLIKGYELLQNEGAESYTIKCTEPLSEEQIARFKGEWGNASFTARFEPISLPDNLKAVILGEKGDNG